MNDKIKITIDSETKNVELARSEVNKLGRSIQNINTYANAFRGTIGKLALVGFGLISATEAKSIKNLKILTNTTSRLKLTVNSINKLKSAWQEPKQHRYNANFKQKNL